MVTIQKTDDINRQFSNRAIQNGDHLEFEISQFSRDDIPRGQANYYGTVYLYIVGKGAVLNQVLLIRLSTKASRSFAI